VANRRFEFFEFVAEELKAAIIFAPLLLRNLMALI
jgi:hypothetical protein